MLLKLKTKMKRNNITIDDIANLLGIRRKSALDKLIVKHLLFLRKLKS